MITSSPHHTIDNNSSKLVVQTVKCLLRELLSDYDFQITARPMFGTWRIFANLVPFCALIGHKLYFRASNDNQHKLFIIGMDVYTGKKEGFHGESRFYRKSNGFNREEIKKHSILSINSFIEEKRKLENANSTRIKNLPNMTIKTERLLKKCGITTQNELVNIGSVNAYHEILKMNKLAENLDILYSIDGALKGIHKATLSLADKADLTRQLQKFGSYDYAN
ncbi:hypothetical protein EIJ81_00175 (plasmid) [Aliivibrio salmonicida]|uniref:TfoX/Sxy family DNA transformation protein n=2 Tax=Aliivibrio salmonicida TaxID=40269 RepID=UPI000F71D5A0|nr:TfoX/Sxy family DNA transformation protein [Aliivibrio salmonicida]AZL83320.1 hypothetical protein EIJ81_00175 [Aliivibrio salmonicida]